MEFPAVTLTPWTLFGRKVILDLKQPPMDPHTGTPVNAFDVSGLK